MTFPESEHELLEAIHRVLRLGRGQDPASDLDRRVQAALEGEEGAWAKWVRYEADWLNRGYGMPQDRNRDARKALGREAKLMDSRRKGGKNSSRGERKGILAATLRLLESQPDATPKELWARFPDDLGCEPEDGFEVFRDGEMLVERDDETGDENSIRFSTFRRYVTKARKLCAE